MTTKRADLVGRPAAFFDVDGTLASSNVISTYVDFRVSGMSKLRRWAFFARFLPMVAYYAFLDTRSRTRFLQTFLRNYTGTSAGALQTWAEAAVHGYWNRKLFAAARASIQDHRDQGHYVVILSGGLRDTLEPIAKHLGVDHLLATRMASTYGRYSGRLINMPLSDSAKAHASRALAEELGLDLSASYAYADSFSDRALLESVGHPVAVNPDRQLEALASDRRWPVQAWKHEAPEH
ncbi:MAG: Phosphoserine phosphatase [Chloroflexi bacterium]|nr:MAG: Phosphoserine phosphatase [Chloroflexota bacterium]